MQWAVARWDHLVVQGVQQVEDWEVQPFLELEPEVRLDSRDRKTTNKIEPMKIRKSKVFIVIMYSWYINETFNSN